MPIERVSPVTRESKSNENRRYQIEAIGNGRRLMVIERRYYLCSRYARFNWWSVEATVSPFISLVVFFSLSLTADGREAYPMTLIVMMMIRPAEAGRESGWPQEETQQVGQSGRGWETVARFPTRLFRARRHASDRKKVKRN